MRIFLTAEDQAGPGQGGEGRIPERDAIAPAHRWNVEDLYADLDGWNRDFDRIEAEVQPLEALRGAINSAADVARLLDAETRLDRLVEKLYTYAHLRADEDTANTQYQALLSRIRARYTEVSGRLAWITPEILAQPEETLREWTDSEELRPNRYAMVRLLRHKPHTLSDREETLLSQAGEVFGASRQTYSLLTNADMRFPSIRDGQGREKELSQGRYITFLLDRDRRVRQDAFNAMYDTYGAWRNTLASTLSSNVKLHNYLARTRHFPSALEAALFEDNIPVGVYDSLIDATHAALPRFYLYTDLRRRCLGLDQLDMFDQHVPIVSEYDIQVPFETACQWVLAACEPLGEEYMEALQSAFTDRWIDVYENRGKRSGAYSSGCYDSLPYVLLNYQGTLDDVFTLAHELGHSMHSWLANRSQPPRFAGYPIFIAEIASTLNEALLLKHLLDQADDPKFRAYLLNHLCDSYKGTVFRQTMFAEYERMIHDMDGRGEPLTPDALCEAYYGLNARYYGDHVAPDKRIAMEWARIPHFYFNFYVYKYATSFCASQVFVLRVLEGATGREQYLDLLRAGGSADPLDLVARAGVDMTDSSTLEKAFIAFEEAVRELDSILKS